MLVILRRIVLRMYLAVSRQSLHLIPPAAYLHALTTVGAAIGIVQRQVTLAADSHAEGSVTEHFYADRLAIGAADALGNGLFVDCSHLVHTQFARQYHHVGKLSIEPERLDIGDIELCGEVNLLPHLAAIHHHSHVRGYDSRDLRLLCSVYYLTHLLQILAIDDGVDREIGLHAPLPAGLRYLLQVADGKRGSGVSTHVQLLNAEVYGVGTGIKGCCEALAGAHRSHDFKCIIAHAIHLIYLFVTVYFPLAAAMSLQIPRGRWSTCRGR